MAAPGQVGKVRGSKGRNDRALGDHGKTAATRMKTSAHTATYGHSAKVPNRWKGRHKAEDNDLKELPVIDVKKYSHHCLQCEASFVSKSQLEKHIQWKHAERTQAAVDVKVAKTVGRGRGRKRATENAEASPKKCKKKKRDLSRPSENGECSPQSRNNSVTNATNAQDALVSNELNKSKKKILMPEEDPERTKHRRKQKTPKKFTGEQPSISGTFGLKGLSKSDDKRRGKGKKKNKSLCAEDVQQKPVGVHVKKEPVTHLPGSQEEKWHQEITEKGEIICPNCVTVHRKTVAGLKKHLEICKELQDALKCQHCGKQFKSKAGLKYHMLAEHNNKPVMNTEKLLDEQQERDRLRSVLKQMGKLKCPNEGCITTFTSLMGYQYHLKRCGKEPEDIEKAVFICEHCEKEYKSKAGHDNHVKCEHTEVTDDSDHKSVDEELENSFEKTPSGRIRRRSAQVAVFHLQDIAEDELSKLWTRRRNKDDLVPDIKRLKYTRPGFPTFNPTQLESWKNEVKENGQICCPNNHCEAIYSSFSGLKAHLATCTKGEHLVGKYRCLICQKEFSSESGVKYHINNSHSENWFRASAEIQQRSRRELKVANPERKEPSSVKKRGRKPREKASELSRRDKEIGGAQTTTDHTTSQCAPGLKSNSKVKRRNTLPSSKKGRCKEEHNECTH
ncbi:zinc finger protein 512B isoform X1 [Amblyraja radiata]|uniref:zinc finger protein 512B isoform X1 n=1 Tax=Amblyraja radiata TaxID=386614 RepID=UPI0014041CB6|nr:zinc finger protein 512B isoform X1 [Amblyraja radiata]